MEEQEQKKKTISKTTFVLMLAVAIFFDVIFSLIQLIPVAGSVAAMVFNVIPLTGFYIWYKMNGLSFANPKKGFTFFGCSFIEFIPFVNILPAWTASVIIMYVIQKKDILLEKAGKVVGGVAGATAIAGAGAKMLGARNLGNSLEKTSKNLTEKKENMRGDLKPLQNPQTPNVGNEIRSNTKQNPIDRDRSTDEFSTRERNTADNQTFLKRKGEENNIIQFPKENQPHNEDWVFRKDKAA